MSSKSLNLTNNNKKLIYILISTVVLATIVLYSMKTGSIEITLKELIAVLYFSFMAIVVFIAYITGKKK